MAVRRLRAAEMSAQVDLEEELVETLAAEEQFDCWNVPDSNGDTPIMWALKSGFKEIVEILVRCPRVDLTCRDKKGWSPAFRAIQKNQHGEKITKNDIH